MTSNKRYIIQALAMLIFTVLMYRDWNIYEARIIYIQLLCLVEIIIQFIYIFFNRKKLNKEVKEKELIIVVIYLIVVVAITLLNMLIVH